MYELERLFQNHLNKLRKEKIERVYTSKDYEQTYHICNNIIYRLTKKEINKENYKENIITLLETYKQLIKYYDIDIINYLFGIKIEIFKHIKEYQEKYTNKIKTIKQEHERYLNNYIGNINTYLNELKYKGYEINEQMRDIEPFQKTYLVNDRLHIIQNNITTNINKIQTQINVYGKKVKYNNNGLMYNLFNSKSQNIINIQGEEYVCTKQYLDNDIPRYANKKRDYYDDNAGISQVAKIIQANKLSEHMREYYDGNITIIGNTKIKPYDNLDIQDRYTNMIGKIEVQQVITKYDNEDGFITTVVPNMLTDTSIPHNIGRAWNVMMNVNTMIVYIAGQVVGQTAFSGLPHFDHFVYNSLGQLDIVLGDFNIGLNIFGEEIND